jgi:16S rRNA (guanine527-N7)-methyltransferase
MCASFSRMKDSNNIIDIGTGAGFPGIPLSIIFEDKRFFLLDSLNKRIQFLSKVTKKLNINNVKMYHGRAEDLGKDKDHREKYDLCLSRAVAKLSVLSEYCLPFVKINGYFAAYKSRNIEQEIVESYNAIEILGGVIEKQSYTSSIADYPLEHQIIYIHKIKHTPQKYPRKAGMPLKNPLK